VTQAPAEETSPAVTDDDEQDFSEQELVRREKLDRLRAAGADPYPVGVARTTSLAAVVAAHPTCLRTRRRASGSA
jgi:lysyl-tRNA synthetase class 2